MNTETLINLLAGFGGGFIATQLFIVIRCHVRASREHRRRIRYLCPRLITENKRRDAESVKREASKLPPQYFTGTVPPELEHYLPEDLRGR